MPAHIHQCAHYGSHHIAQKSVGGDGKHPLVAFHCPSSIGHSAVIGLGIGVKFAETGEIGVTEQMLCRLVHHLKIERGRTLPTQRIGKRIFARMGKILICATHGIKSRMGIVVNGENRIDGYISRQHAVELMHQLRGIGYGRGIEVGYHGGGIHSGIGAPGAGYLHRLAHYHGHSFLYGLLHRYVVWLALPSVKFCPSIG